MLASVAFLNFDNVKMPNVYAILICYLVFMLLYFCWDRLEKEKTTDKKEKEYYKNRVIPFEIFSIFSVLLAGGIYFFWETHYCLVVLPIITVLFLGISIEKKNHYKGNA